MYFLQACIFSLFLVYSTVIAADRQNCILLKERMFDPQVLLDQDPDNHMCHASSIVEAKNGTLICVFYAGQEEGEGHEIWMCKKPVGGTWSTPKQFTKTGGDVFNPVLFQPKVNPDAPLLLYFRIGAWDGSGVVLYSDDNGETWYEPPNGEKYPDYTNQPNGSWGTDLPLLPSGHCMDVNRFGGPDKALPLELPSGSLLFGSGMKGGSRWRFNIEQTPTDNYYSGNWILNEVCVEGTQPTFIVLSPDYQNLKVLMRLSSPFVSDDGGATWTQSSGQPDNGGSAMAAITLDNGWHACAHTPGRDLIKISVSEDGSSWTQAVIVEDEPPSHSYPFMFMGSDGYLHLSWTWVDVHGGGSPGEASIGHAIIEPNLLVGLPATKTGKNSPLSPDEKKLAIKQNKLSKAITITYAVETDGYARLG
ncbi:MAG: hypothetical protein GF401_20260, partial [Chitinivibrionales bacterium]|nr:hypothetical protein [Chitinivibrionales bacterium]